MIAGRAAFSSKEVEESPRCRFGQVGAGVCGWVGDCDLLSSDRKRRYLGDLPDAECRASLSMDVATKTFDQARREFEAAEFELEVKVKETLDKIRNVSGKNYDDQIMNKEWEAENRAALQRNKQFLKDLEFTKAKLRSRYYYQPAMNHFDSQLKKYESHMESQCDLKKYK